MPGLKKGNAGGAALTARLHSPSVFILAILLLVPGGLGLWLVGADFGGGAKPKESPPVSSVRIQASVSMSQASQSPPERVGKAAAIAPKASLVDGRFKARAVGEWDGRLVDVVLREPCNDFGSCGLARACLADGVCGACSDDSDCDPGELCVLDNCLLTDRVHCRNRNDCPAGEVCMIEDDRREYGWRGNESLVAGCSGSDIIRQAATGGRTEPQGFGGEQHIQPEIEPQLPSNSRLGDDLREFVAEQRRKATGR